MTTAFTARSVVIMRFLLTIGILACGLTGAQADATRISVPIADDGSIDLGDLVAKLAEATKTSVELPPGEVRLPVSGVSGSLSRTMLTSTLGSGVRLSQDARTFTLELDAQNPAADWPKRVSVLAAQTAREAKRRMRYGVHALQSYRPNDPGRPTVFLVHGVNSSSYGFVHMIKPLEEAGYGVVVYDYPYNRSLEASCSQFARDLTAFRERMGEKQKWSILAHSMGALVSRGYVEGDEYKDDVSDLLLIAPVNKGSSLAKTQTLLQFLNGLQSVGGPRPTSDALAHLGDGLGEAATDMSPGSVFLKRLNARPRREGLAYHILAGDAGILSRATRAQIDSQLGSVRKQGGLLGGLMQMATGDLTGQLDEVSDGTGDGCVSVARTKLDGVTSHETMHANHAELIRAPLLFPDPGPVACMPYVLKWLPKPEKPSK